MRLRGHALCRMGRGYRLRRAGIVRHGAASVADGDSRRIVADYNVIMSDNRSSPGLLVEQGSAGPLSAPMCGRYGSFLPAEAIARIFGAGRTRM